MQGKEALSESLYDLKTYLFHLYVRLWLDTDFIFPQTFKLCSSISLQRSVWWEKVWYQSSSYYFTGILTSLEAFRRASSIPGIWRFQLWIRGVDLVPLVQLAYTFTSHSHHSTAPGRLRLPVPQNGSAMASGNAAAIFSIWCTAVAQQTFAERTVLLRYNVVCLSPAQEIFLSNHLIISFPLSSLFFLSEISIKWLLDTPEQFFLSCFFTSLSFCSLHWVSWFNVCNKFVKFLVTFSDYSLVLISCLPF